MPGPARRPRRYAGTATGMGSETREAPDLVPVAIVAGRHAVVGEWHPVGLDHAAEDLARDGREAGIVRQPALELRSDLVLLGRIVAQRPQREDGEGNLCQLLVMAPEEATSAPMEPAHVETGAEHDEVVLPQILARRRHRRRDSRAPGRGGRHPRSGPPRRPSRTCLRMRPVLGSCGPPFGSYSEGGIAGAHGHRRAPGLRMPESRSRSRTITMSRSPE